MSCQVLFKKVDPVIYCIEYEVDSGSRKWMDVHMCRTEKVHKNTLDSMRKGRSYNGIRIIAPYEYRPKETSKENGL